jgi:hypothetical protein
VAVDKDIKAYEYAIGWKHVTVAQLKELLAKLPDDAQIGCNRMYNLLVVHHKGDYYIDLYDGTLEELGPRG